ncbi:MAG TPA: glycosyltransferase family 9 protein, partial [Isosphaeraceae bacterium]
MTDGAPTEPACGPGLLSRLPEAPRTVALVRASRIGDFVCATPAFRALRAALPGAEITLIALPMVRAPAERSPHLDRFEAFPGFPGIAEQVFDARRAVRFFRRMQAERFDLAVQMHGSGAYSNPFTLMLGARVTAGFVRAGEPPGRLDAALAWPRGLHEVRRVLALMDVLGIPARGERTEFPLWPEDHAAAEALLAGVERPLIGLHPSAREATKRWASGRFAAAGA